MRNRTKDGESGARGTRRAPWEVLRLAVVPVLVAGLVPLGAGRSEALLLSTLYKTTSTLTTTLDTTTKTLVDTVDSTTDVVVDTVESTTGLVTGLAGWHYTDAETSLRHVAEVIDADDMWRYGVTGRGVGVALIDTGVVPVDGLTSGNVVNGPDLSFESQVDSLRHLDTYGHGTHMAGIIAGRDADGGTAPFRGIAPRAELTTVKAGSYEGAVDVSQVIAAIDWVVQNRNTGGRNIRVLNLSFGTDGVQDYRLDPLTHAVENAWRHGIVVVVSGGNDGAEASKLDNPAYDPYVIAVGAADTHDTVSTLDDTVPAFSTRGAPSRRVDLVAPGQSIVSLRSPGSRIDELNPGARVGERYLKGSGTSQAAAVVSGAVALLLEHRPHLSPDQVKQLLRTTARSMPAADDAGKGAGIVSVYRAAAASVPSAQQTWPRSTGLGSLHAARGSSLVADDGVDLTGERHILGAWNPAAWAPASAAGSAWTGGTWAGTAWAGTCWCGTSWASATWSPATWLGTTWAGNPWPRATGTADDDWSGKSWSGKSWSGKSWSGKSWSGKSWSGKSWSAATAPGE